MPQFKDAEEIYELYSSRVVDMGPSFARMKEVSDVINGDIVLPLPELHHNEKVAVSNLSQQGLDQLSRRIASVMPNVYFPTWGNTDQAEKDANKRMRVTLGWWAENWMKKVLNRRARWYLGYASAPVVIKPGWQIPRPKWIPRSPVNTLPSDTDIDQFTPSDCIFRTTHTYRWLVDNYPQQAAAIAKPENWDLSEPASWNTPFEVVEYNDANEDTLVLIGADNDDTWGHSSPGSKAEILLQTPNRAGIPWAVVPGRMSLDKPIGHFDGILGMYQTMAELMAMQIIATKRGIWAREWLVSNPGETARVVTVPDPARGIPGKVQGGKIERQVLDPAFQALQVIHDMENSQRQTAGLPPELGGQAATNIRTGKRGSQVLGSAIDFTIQEANDLFAESLYYENKRAIAIDKAYFRGKKTYHIITRSWSGKIDYEPSKLWEADDHVVDYPFAGVDLQNLVIEGSQRVAQETMSPDTFMEMDPAIADAVAERSRLHVNKARRAFFTSFEQAAATPEGPYRPEDVAKIIKYLKAGMDPEDALVKYNEELKELQQAAQDEELPPEAMQPGLAPPGAPGELTSIPEQQPSMQHLTSMLSGLGKTQTAQRYRQ